uniref:Heterogeneous nuclear ribonucleoprotein A1-like isoform X2 n=1 Tax=Rhizophora mucronata TaxID=61149 RepID=A0A2P2LM43_RHIMU
MLELRINENEI